MSTKHTPGPWSVEDPMGPELLQIVANANAPVYEWRWIAQVGTEEPEDRFDVPPDEARANARLIAAAPEMYEALKAQDALMKSAGTISDAAIREATAKMRAAIAKAEGRS